MNDSNDTAARIALAHDQLAEKLEELRRRERHARTRLSPIRHLASPWLYVGIAAVVGYRLGRPGPHSAPAETVPARDETLTHAVVRASLVAVAQAIVRRLVLASDAPP